MKTGERIKELRKKRGLNQSELAEIVKSSTTMISMIEANKSKPTIELLTEFSDFFNVSIDYLVTGKEEAATISPDEQEIIKAVREDTALFNTLKETINFKKKMMAQIRMLNQRPMDKQQQAEHA